MIGSPNPGGLCFCGCGGTTPIADRNRAARGWVRGEHMRYIAGHQKVVSKREAPNPGGLCMCGCGQTTPIASSYRVDLGHVKGEHTRFVQGHVGKHGGGRQAGFTHSGETRRKMSIAQRGRSHPRWSETPGYSAIHVWLRRNYKKTGTCERCGRTLRTEWANVSGRYDREDRNDWAELCRSCHVTDDRANPKRPNA